MQRTTADARVDMVALLGNEARFTQNCRAIDLSDWLNHGIDTWVWLVADCLRGMLLSGARETATVTNYGTAIRKFFEFLVWQARKTSGSQSIPEPRELSPAHVNAFVAWIKQVGRARGWNAESVRQAFKGTKPVLLEMFAQGHIPGEPSRLFSEAKVEGGEEESRHTSLSESEQKRLANAIKSDLVALHQNHISLNPGDVQVLRLLLVAHRQGTNPTPLLELRRDSLQPGFLPGTIRLRTAKHRNRKVTSATARGVTQADVEVCGEGDVVFKLAEGALLQQAIASSEVLVAEAPPGHKNKVWLYRTQMPGERKDTVTCLTSSTLRVGLNALVERHQLLADDGTPLKLNLSRLRKSFFDRAFRVSDGDLLVTANLMGNTPQVAGEDYPTMNASRKAEAADYLNNDYVALLRGIDQGRGSPSNRAAPRVVEIKPFERRTEASAGAEPTATPVSGCHDTLRGEHAPGDGNNHCDRYVMCLFCSSFAVVGSIDELWRLFSFQVFARTELLHLDTMLGPERTADDALEDLRDRYRIVIPYIDQFTQLQFAPSVIAVARTKTADALHPFWTHEIAASQRARARTGGEPTSLG